MGFGPTMQLTGVRETIKELKTSAARARDLRPVQDIFGKWMVTASIPENFKQRGRPTKWPAANRYGSATSDPLYETGGLLRSVSYVVKQGDLFLTSPLEKARLHNFGGTVVPKKGVFLVRPIVGPGALTITQARTMGPRDFPGAFVLMHGPFGPGVYIKGTQSVTTYRHTRGKSRAKGNSGNLRASTTTTKSVVRIFAFMKKAKVPKREFLMYQAEDVQRYGRAVVLYVVGDQAWRNLA